MLLEEFLQYENGTSNPPTVYDTNLALQSGNWSWSDLEPDEYHLVGWSWQKYDEWFEDEDGYWWYRLEGDEDWQPYEE